MKMKVDSMLLLHKYLKKNQDKYVMTLNNNLQNLK